MSIGVSGTSPDRCAESSSSPNDRGQETRTATRDDAALNQIEAIYRNGVFEPLGAVELRETERVRLNVEPVARPDLLAWLDDVRQLQAKLVAKRGVFPDSTADIADDRRRLGSWPAARKLTLLPTIRSDR
jgi:predicted DNA-binding antitoxin AbrB/MazE fold protein